MSDKIKVYELAKNLGVTSVFLMDKIRREWKLPVKSHMEALTPELTEKIKEKFSGTQTTKKVKGKKVAAKPSKRLKTTQKEIKTSSVKKKVAVTKKTEKEKDLKETAASPVRPVERKKIIRRKKADQPKLQPLSSEGEKPSGEIPFSESPEGRTPDSEKEAVAKAPPPPTLDTLWDISREEKKPPKKPGAEKTFQSKFQAADFRKREVIFQPKKKRLVTSGEAKKTKITVPKSHKRIVKVHGEMEVKTLAKTMGVKTRALIKKLKSEGIEVKDQSVLDFDTIALIAPEFNFEAKNTKKTEKELLDILSISPSKNEGQAETKPPVVTIMGHVDHGKTTLLDTIRKTKVAEGEAGGITQHIGAYSVSSGGKFITFIDTPGHEAFTAMRSRGVQATDIVVVVVSAMDGVMPQTVEALNHVKAAKIPLIIAVNKMDVEGANPDKVQKQLAEHNILSEEWGGDVGFVPLSALKGDGVKDLLERILLVAELQELKYYPKKPARGLVLEARMEKGRGSIVNLLVQDGVLKSGQNVLAGESIGRVKQMKNDQSQVIKSVEAGFPVEVTGFDVLPQAGDRFDVVTDEKAGKRLIEVRKSGRQTTSSPALSPEELLLKIHSSEEQAKELNVILKADVSGSLEALKSTLEKLKGEKVSLKIIHSAVGGITESDVLLAAAASAVVLGFNVRPDGKALKKSREKGVSIQTGSVIYEMVDQVKPLLLGLLTPETVIEEKGRAEVREIFHISRVGTVAGCYVLSGEIQRNSFVRLVRDGTLVHEGKLSSLKRFKEDAKEVSTGFECGISIENFNDVKPKDILETYIKKEVQKTEF